jgi:CMP-N-acetylneuraminic acid synthetase
MILGLIPARGGSRRIPRKNLRMLAGKPLLKWTVDAALGSTMLDRIVVSSEDDEIRVVSVAWGAEVLERPPDLATDTATTAGVLRHAAVTLNPKVVVLLQPTSPIRFRGLIDRCVKTFLEVGCDTLATGFISYQYPYGSMGNVPQQEMEGFFYDDGNVYVHKARHLKIGKWWGERRHEMVVDPWYNLELDTVADFWMAEGLIHRLHQ